MKELIRVATRAMDQEFSVELPTDGEFLSLYESNGVAIAVFVGSSESTKQTRYFYVALSGHQMPFWCDSASHLGALLLDQGKVRMALAPEGPVTAIDVKAIVHLFLHP